MRLWVRSVCVCWPTLLMVDEVKLVISQQEKLLVHGEPERNNMVQYFSEQLAALKEEGYELGVGPGVWDIHSPRVPAQLV